MAPINEYRMVFGIPITRKQTTEILCKYFPEKVAEVEEYRRTSRLKIETQIRDTGLVGDKAEQRRRDNWEEIEEQILFGPFGDCLGDDNTLPNGLYICFMPHDHCDFFGDCYAVLGMFVGTKNCEWSKPPEFTVLHPDRYASLMSSLSPNDQVVLKIALAFEGSEDYYQKGVFGDKQVPSHADFESLIRQIKEDDPCDLLYEIFPPGIEPRMICVLDDCLCCT